MSDPINGLIATTRLHLLRLDAAIAADQADAPRLTPLRDDRYAHLDGAGGGVPAGEPGGLRHGRADATAAPTSAASAPPPQIELPDTPEEIVSSVRGDAATAQVQFTDAISSASRYRAALYGSIAAALATPPGGARMTSSHSRLAHRRARARPDPPIPAPRSSRVQPPPSPPAALAQDAVAGAAARIGRRAGRGMGLRARRRLQPGRRRDDRRRPRRTPAAPRRDRGPARGGRRGGAGTGCRVPGVGGRGRTRRRHGSWLRTSSRTPQARGGSSSGRPTTPSYAASRCSGCPTPPCGWPCGSRWPASCPTTIPFPGPALIPSLTSSVSSGPRHLGRSGRICAPRTISRSRSTISVIESSSCAPVARSRTSTTPVRDPAADDADRRHAEQLRVGELDADRGGPVVEQHAHTGGVQSRRRSPLPPRRSRRPCRR